MTLPASRNVLERQILTLLSTPRLLLYAGGQMLGFVAQESCLLFKRYKAHSVMFQDNTKWCSEMFLFSWPDSQLALGLLKGHTASVTTEHCSYFSAILYHLYLMLQKHILKGIICNMLKSLCFIVQVTKQSAQLNYLFKSSNRKYWLWLQS